MVLVVNVIVMTIRGVILLVLAREAPLHALIHRRTFQPLLWHLSLVIQSLIYQLLMHLVCLVWSWSTNHSPPCWSTWVVLLLAHIKIVWSISLGLIAIRRICCIVSWSHIVLLAEAFDLSQYTKTTLRRNETWYNLLCHVLRRSSEQVFELDGTKLLDDCALLTNTLVESFLKLVQLSFFFVKILYKSSSSLLHFTQSTL